VWEALREAKVVLLPGRAMHCRANDPTFRSPFMRVSYSNAAPEDLEEGMRRLGQVLRQHAAAQAAAGTRAVAVADSLDAASIDSSEGGSACGGMQLG
jgi:hypothetical protein